MAEGVGAFLLAAALILLTGLVRPVAGLISRIPSSVAAGVLAGVLLPFCPAVPHLAAGNPVQLLPSAMQDTYPSQSDRL